MCDELTEKESQQFLLNDGKINRHYFSKMGASAILTAVLPRLTFAADVTESIVEIMTPEGASDCYFVHPATGQQPGIILWPNLKGLRPAYKAMGRL